MTLPRPGNRRVAWLFLRLLGLCFLAAFLSLGVQVVGLIGEDGLLPLGEFLSAAGRELGGERTWQLPTVFWAASDDRALRLGIGAGILCSLALLLDLAPRAALALLWLLYLSFVTGGREFLSFQWDNLLLESAFLGIFLAPGHALPSRAARAKAPEPHPVLVFLFRWLLFRLLFESGLSKLLAGDPTWRDLTALATYYETAPLPTWIGWHAHQLPLAAHRSLSAATLGFELLAPFAIFGPRQVRAFLFLLYSGFQLAILLTANYGFFNYLSLALGVFLLDDGYLGRGAPSPDPGSAGLPRRQRRALAGGAFAALAALVVSISVVEFASMWIPDEELPRPLVALRDRAAPFRSVNRYHLFASMTLRRLEVEIQGTADGKTWQAYAFRAKPGDPRRAPPIVAPHQPRLDFQLWFLTLHGARGVPAYFLNLLRRLCDAPDRMAPFFARDPFPQAPPAEIRVAVYRYRMSSREEKRRDGVWWVREPVGYLGRVRCGEATASPAPSQRTQLALEPHPAPGRLRRQ